MTNSSKFDSLINIIVQSIQDVKGNNISLLDFREIENRVSDYFVICDGNSNIQVNAISSSVTKKVSKNLIFRTVSLQSFQKASLIRRNR